MAVSCSRFAAGNHDNFLSRIKNLENLEKSREIISRIYNPRLPLGHENIRLRQDNPSFMYQGKK